MRFLHAVGAPTDRLLGRAHISPLLLDDQEALIPFFSAYRFLELAARGERLEDLGLVVGQQLSSFELGAFGQALQRAVTVWDYLQTGIQWIGVHSSGTRFWLSTEGNAFRLSQHLKGPAGLGRCIADVFTLAVTLGTLRRVIGPDWSPGKIRLMTGDETLVGDPQHLWDAPIIPGQRHSSFTIARSVMTLPVPRGPTASPPNQGPLDSSTPMPADFVTSMEHLVRSLMGDKHPSIQTAAEAAGMGARTLQRRLAQAGMSYSGLITASRVHLAKDWLTGTDVPIAEIAAMLSYSDASNFARAFRRETGMSPQSYRRSLARR